MEKLGYEYDLAVGFVPVDMDDGVNVGEGVSLDNADGVDIVIFKAEGTAGDDPVITLEQGIDGANYVALKVDHYYQKQDADLAGIAWARVAVGVAGVGAATITGDGDSAEEQAIYLIPIEGDSLADGYNCVRATVADPGHAELGCALYILRSLHAQRKPANLPSTTS